MKFIKLSFYLCIPLSIGQNLSCASHPHPFEVPDHKLKVDIMNAYSVGEPEDDHKAAELERSEDQAEILATYGIGPFYQISPGGTHRPRRRKARSRGENEYDLRTLNIPESSILLTAPAKGTGAGAILNTPSSTPASTPTMAGLQTPTFSNTRSTLSGAAHSTPASSPSMTSLAIPAFSSTFSTYSSITQSHNLSSAQQASSPTITSLQTPNFSSTSNDGSTAQSTPASPNITGLELPTFSAPITTHSTTTGPTPINSKHETNCASCHTPVENTFFSAPIRCQGCNVFLHKSCHRLLVRNNNGQQIACLNCNVNPLVNSNIKTISKTCKIGSLVALIAAAIIIPVAIKAKNDKDNEKSKNKWKNDAQN